MKVLTIEEGQPFSLAEDDVTHLIAHLGTAVAFRRHEIVVWGVVGHIQLPSGITLIIRSKKAPVACLLAWAAYCDPSLSALAHLRHLDEIGDLADVTQALAALFVRELLAVTGAHGVRRKYHRVRTASTNIRGSIDFARLSRLGGNLARVPCVTWERLRITPLNQLFAAVLTRISRNRVLRAATGAGLLELMAAFEDVPPRVDADLLTGRRGLQRDEQPFSNACAIARLLLNGAGLGTGVTQRGLGFVVRLASLFEQAVVRALADGGLTVADQKPVQYARGDSNAFAYFIDAYVHRLGGDLVVDAKYKTDIPPSVVQQMVTYCHLTGAKHAALVYPRDQVDDQRPFILRAPSGETIQVAVLELDSSGRSVEAWRSNGLALASRIRALGT